MAGPRAKHRAGSTRGMVRTSRVRRREAEHTKAHGPCEQCGGTKNLEAYWRNRGDRAIYGNIQAYWLSSDQIRANLADRLVVLCNEHMRTHKGGAQHGGGTVGIKSCDCAPCKERRKQYLRDYRAAQGKVQ